MIFYIQVDQDNYITDCTEQLCNNYIVTDLELPLPEMFITGIYKYLGNGKVELDIDKKEQLLKNF